MKSTKRQHLRKNKNKAISWKRKKNRIFEMKGRNDDDDDAGCKTETDT